MLICLSNASSAGESTERTVFSPESVRGKKVGYLLVDLEGNGDTMTARTTRPIKVRPRCYEQHPDWAPVYGMNTVEKPSQSIVK
jgi:hypothetical protein